MAMISVCDICRTQKNVSQVSFVIGRSIDAAGSMEDNYETFDLCLLHHKEILANTINVIREKLNLDLYNINKTSIDLIKKRMQQ